MPSWTWSIRWLLAQSVSNGNIWWNTQLFQKSAAWLAIDQWESRDCRPMRRQGFVAPELHTSSLLPILVPGSAKPAESFLTPQLLWTYALNISSDPFSLISSSKSLKIQILSYSLNACLAVRFIAKNGDFEKPENSLKNTQSLSETLLMFFWLTKWTNCELIGLPFREG